MSLLPGQDVSGFYQGQQRPSWFGTGQLPQIGGWGGPQRVTNNAPQPYGNFIRQFNQGGFRQPSMGRAQSPNMFGYGRAMQRQMPQPAGNSTPWNDPRRMQRDPRLMRGAHPMQQQQRPQPQQGRGWGGFFPNGVNNNAQMYGAIRNAFANRINQPTAPATMGGKPRGQWGRMY